MPKPLLLLLCLWMLLAVDAGAQVSHQRKWFVPDAVVVQHAGNMGFLAAGPGYTLAKDKLHLEVLYGYVPQLQAEKALHLITFKPVFTPQQVPLGADYSLMPLRLGMGLSYYFGDQFSILWDERYPDGYYWWPTRLRLLGYAGAALGRSFPETNTIRQVDLYGELNTYDLIVTQWVKDSRIRGWDIVSFSVGLRVAF